MRARKRNTEAGPNQDKPWTPEMENLAWQTFLLGPPGSGRFGTIARLTGKSVKACQRKIQKIYLMEGTVATWKAHSHVRLNDDRENENWSEMDDFVLEQSLDEGLPIDRVAALLGREPESCQRRYNHLDNGDMPSLI